MKVAEHQKPDLSDAAIRSATGKGWDEWFAVLDAFGGPPKGRRELGQHLYVDHKVDQWWIASINERYEAARGVVARDGRPQGYMICATKTVNAPVEKAYEAWTSAAAMQKWFSTQVEWDFREGGRYSSADGDAGTINKIRLNKNLRFTWEQPRHTPGTVVEVTYQPKGEKCVVMVAHDRIQTREEAEELRASWLAALDDLKGVLEAR